MEEQRIRFDEHGRMVDDKDKENAKQERMDPFEYEQELRRREDVAYRRRLTKFINPALYGAIALAIISFAVILISLFAGGKTFMVGIPMVIVVLCGLFAIVLSATALAMIRSAGVHAKVQTKYSVLTILGVIVVWVIMGVMIML